MILVANVFKTKKKQQRHGKQRVFSIRKRHPFSQYKRAIKNVDNKIYGK